MFNYSEFRYNRSVTIIYTECKDKVHWDREKYPANKSMMDKNIGDSADGFQNIIIWIIVIGEIQKAISFLINIPGNEMNIFICFSHLTE